MLYGGLKRRYVKYKARRRRILMGFFAKLFGTDKKEVKRIKDESSVDKCTPIAEKKNDEPSNAQKSVKQATPVPQNTQPKKTNSNQTGDNSSKSEVKKAVAPSEDSAQKPTVKAKAEKSASSDITKKEERKSVSDKADIHKDSIADEDENIETTDEVIESEITQNTSTGRFEVKKTKDGRYVFNLYASNHVIIATSQIYSSTQSAFNGINSVIKNAPIAEVEDRTLKNITEKKNPKWEIYLDKSEQYRFRLNAPNGDTICHSQGYTSKANCKNGIDSIVRHASSAEIEKAYLKKKDTDTDN